MTDNPNAPSNAGNTPINDAAHDGYTEIVKILAPLANNRNASDKDGRTPIDVAKTKEIREILKSFK